VPELRLAANHVTFGGFLDFGHLQIVYESGTSQTEIEVQAPGNVFLGNWTFPGPWDHRINTPYYGEPDNYAITTINTGDKSVDGVWNIIQQVNQSFQARGGNINYLPEKNSNSFVASVLYTLGIDASALALQLIGGNIDWFPGLGANVLLSESDAIRLTINGGDDDDFIRGGVKEDTFKGQEGDDHLDGGRGDDDLEGGADNDTLLGGAGDDVLDGGENDDELFGGDDKDVVYGGGGKDTIDGGDGNDNLNGEAGKDGLVGGAGDDRISGGEENDLIDGGADGDELYGDGGDDGVVGGAGRDRLFGGTGKDTLVGGQGVDALNGEADNDIIDAAQDDSSGDFMRGGAGDDHFLTNNGDVIQDIDRGDRVIFEGRLLTGGEKDAPPRDPCDPTNTPPSGKEGTYTGADGTEYSLSGSTLTVTSGSSAITIENFRNGDAGIRLKETRPNSRQAECNRDPLIIDLDGDRNVVRELYDSSAYFDLDNDGMREHVAWTLGGDGLLVHDRNGNGVIDDGTELFGSGRVAFDSTFGSSARSGTDGFAELSGYDSNEDGRIDASDSQFGALRLWVDADGDGETDEGELRTLGELGLQSISLSARASDDVDCGCDGTEISHMATVTRTDGSTTGIYDAYLSIDQYDTREASPVDVPAHIRALPFLIGSGAVSDLDVAMTRDPALEELVRRFAGLEVGDAHLVPGLIEQIILRWTGGDQVAPDSRGISINARWLTAIEKISGSDFAQLGIGPNPRAESASMLIREWNELAGQVTAKLLGQTELGAAIMPGLSFAAGAFHAVAEGTTLSSVLEAAASHAPAVAGEALPYWASVTASLLSYRSHFGVTENELYLAVQAQITPGSLPIPASAFSGVIMVGEGSGMGVGTSEFFFGRINLSGNDVIVALPGASRLAGVGRDDRYLVSKAVGSIDIDDSAGTGDTLMLYDWHRNESQVSAAIDSYRPASDPAGISASISIRIAAGSTGSIVNLDASFIGGRLQTGIEKVSFADGTEVSLLDLFPAELALPDGSGVLRIGSASAGSVGGGAGNDLLVGRSAADAYRLMAGSSSDIILDSADWPSVGDVLHIDAVRADVRFTIAGSVLQHLDIALGSGDDVLVSEQWSAIGGGVDYFEFADGERLSASALKALLTTGTAAADDISGTYGNDVIDGRGGIDKAVGGYGDDIYLFGAGYGSLTISDFAGQNALDFGSGLTLADLSLKVRPEGLVISVAGSGDVVRLAANPNGDHFVIRAAGEEASASEILFGEALKAGTTTNGVVYGTMGDDQIVGTDAAELIDGLGGRDSLNGGLGNDTILFGGGRVSIGDMGFGFDTLLVSSEYSLEDFVFTTGPYGGMRLRVEGTADRADISNFFTYGTGAAASAAYQIERILFADGRSIDIGNGKRIAGTAGDDVLFSYSQGSDTFTPGAGNDRIFAINGWHGLTLTAGHGHDVYHSSRGVISFSGILLDGAVDFALSGNDLLVTTAFGADSLLIKNAFQYGELGSFDYLHFSGASLTPQQIANRLGVATEGDDLLFGRTALDGGAGDDTLIGSNLSNAYTFGRGYGADIIKEMDGGFGTGDTLTLAGLTREDVTFRRHPTDPHSIVMTIKDTGETLTFDGTPFDDFVSHSTEDFLGDGYPTGDRSGAHWIETILFADGSSLSHLQVEQAILEGERTQGTDRLVNFGAPSGLNGPTQGAVLDGGAGDDLYVNPFDDVFVRFGPGSGRDVLDSEPQGRFRVHVELEGLAPEDVLVRFENREGRSYTLLVAKDGSELAIEGMLSPRDGLSLEIKAADGSVYDPLYEGGLVARTIGTAGSDLLTGMTAYGGPEEGGYRAFSERFEPGAGDDVIAGAGGSDIIIFERGGGADLVLGSPELAAPDESGEWDRAGHYRISFGAGIERDDLGIQWVDDGTYNVRLSLGGGDMITVDARDLAGVMFADGDQISFESGTQDLLFVYPGWGADQYSDDQTFFAVNGDIGITLRPDSGSDRLIDAWLSGFELGVPKPENWRPSDLDLTGGGSLSDFEFVRDTSNPANLVIRNLASGSSLTVEGQFAYELAVPGANAAWHPLDADGDGTAGWGAVDVDEDGVGDFEALDSDGDGIPNWLNPDFDGDGESDWDFYFEHTIDSDGDGEEDVYAYDDNGDGLSDYFSFELEGVAYGWVDFRDVDGDRIPDEYLPGFLWDTEPQPWAAIPTHADGSKDWSAIDINGDGVGDAMVLDGDADGMPDWLSPDLDGDGQSDWHDESEAELYDADDNFVASRRFVAETGNIHYELAAENDDGDELVARDTDGDLIPDEFGLDRGSDLIADPVPVPTIIGEIEVERENPDGSVTYLSYDWSDIAGRVIDRDESQGAGTNPPVIDLFALRPRATNGDDMLLALEFETIQGRGGNDLIFAGEGGVTILFGRGSGHDVLTGGEPGASDQSNVVRMTGIDSIGQLQFLRGAGESDDLVIRIAATSETLTIRDQFARDGDGIAAPVVGTFQLAGGQTLSWAIVQGFVTGSAVTGDDELATGAEGGLLDGGEGADRLRGGTGDDVYRLGRDYGEDVILDFGGTDLIAFGEGIGADDLFFSRTGPDGGDLLIEVTGVDRLAVTVKGQFLEESARIEMLQLADGTLLGWHDIERFILDAAATGGNDTILGFSSADRIDSEAGSDLLTGGSGDDELDGGYGRDSAAFRGSRVQYEVTTTDGVTVVRDRVAGRDGVDVLRNIEDLSFAGDGSSLALVAPNRAPTAQGFAAIGQEDSDLVIARAELFERAADADGDTLILAGLSAAAGSKTWFDLDGNLRFRGAPDFSGSTYVDYHVEDGQGGRATGRISIELASVTDVPAAIVAIGTLAFDEDRPISAALPATLFRDADGDPLTIVIGTAGGGSLPGWLSFEQGSLIGRPPADFYGTVALDARASDGSNGATIAFDLVIRPVNDVPRVASPVSDIVLTGGGDVMLALPPSFTDADGEPLQFAVRTADGAALPSWLSFDGTTLAGTAPAGFAGSIELVAVASDGRTSVEDMFTISAVSGNRAPILVAPIASVTVNEDAAIDFTVPAGSFSDPDGDALILGATLAGGDPLPSWLSFSDGRFVATPPANFNGIIPILLSASDGALTTETSFDLIIRAVNDAPVVQGVFADVLVPEDHAIDVAVGPATFSDPDGDPLTLSVTLDDGSELPQWLGFAAGRLVGTPPANFAGVLHLRVAAGDGQTSSSGLLDLVISPVNDAPAAADDRTFLVTGGDDLTILAASLLENDIDVDGDLLRVVSVTNGLNGTVSINAQGEIVYSPDFGYVGTDSFQYSISDGMAASAATVSILVADPFEDWMQGSEARDNLHGNMSSPNKIFGAGGDDHVRGGKLGDQLAGGLGNDDLLGLQGEDSLWGMAGDDRLNGGPDQDTAFFAGLRSTYELFTAAGQLYVRDTDPLGNGNDGTDRLVGVERLSFRGGEMISIASPIVLDLDGDGIELVGAAQSRARFDMDDDGRRDDTSWIGAGDAILFFDADANGTLSGAAEFSFADAVPNASSDLVGLASFDRDGDGRIAAGDTAFDRFRLWRDGDGDGAVDRGEILTLREAGVAAIGLAGTPTSLSAQLGGAPVINTGTYARMDGSVGTFADAAFTYFARSEPSFAGFLGRIFGARGKVEVDVRSGAVDDPYRLFAEEEVKGGDASGALYEGLSTPTGLEWHSGLRLNLMEIV
jgi:Ca2+-binding RTX toxin-like protein